MPGLESDSDWQTRAERVLLARSALVFSVRQVES